MSLSLAVSVSSVLLPILMACILCTYLVQCDNKILYDTLHCRTHTYKNRSNWMQPDFLFCAVTFSVSFVLFFCFLESKILPFKCSWAAFIQAIDVRRFRHKWAGRYPFFFCSSVNNNLHSNKFGNGLFLQWNIQWYTISRLVDKASNCQDDVNKKKRHWACSNLVIWVFEMGSGHYVVNKIIFVVRKSKRWYTIHTHDAI